jgi:HPt (histidine-containing phosphotransfer) domain-containing protein
MISNVTAILQRLGISEEIYNELLCDFIVLAQDKYSQLEKAVAINSIDDVKKIAHSIRGCAANLGIETIAEISKNIENNASDGILSETTKKCIVELGRQILLCKIP